MDLDRYRKALEERQQELAEQIARSRNEGREARTAEVEDPIDVVTSSEQAAEQFQVGSIESDMLEQVRAALQRMDDGTYGKCIDCGRPIGETRLDAIPWTPYCLEDQDKHDRQGKEASLLES
ncbi:MAG: TraR/DksA family transcriptional regulator [Acidobacteriaceae bacterium]|nr:TraR/DksA family transcriptional regulator [Acidobacteriaceae bacterium]MBV9443978.1 TraR/DksA family transcriptional regulator [Acidobacteriaceae bacterium]